MNAITLIIENLNKNPWIIFIASVFTILSVVLAIVFFVKGLKKKDPRYSIRSNRLIKDFTQQINGLSILYSNKPVSSVTVSKLAFWNKGKETINKNDFAKADPFLIEIDSQYEILSAEIIYSTNKTNLVTCILSRNKKRIFINFDYFDRKQGFVIQILHTGTTDQCLKMKGTIKSVGALSKRQIFFEPFYIRVLDMLFLKFNIDRKKYKSIIFKINGWSVIIGCLFVLVMFLISLIKGNVKKEDILLLLFIIIYGSLGVSLVKSIVPHEFKEFYEIIE